MIRRYRGRISGPLLERIDLHVEVPRLPPRLLHKGAPTGEDSATVRERVTRAWHRQTARAGRLNGQLDVAGTLRDCFLSSADEALLEQAIEQWQLSARSLHRILRVARTIADLEGSEDIQRAHLAEAIGYRRMDRDAV